VCSSDLFQKGHRSSHFLVHISYLLVPSVIRSHERQHTLSRTSLIPSHERPHTLSRTSLIPSHERPHTLLRAASYPFTSGLILSYDQTYILSRASIYPLTASHIPSHDQYLSQAYKMKFTYVAVLLWAACATAAATNNSPRDDRVQCSKFERKKAQCYDYCNQYGPKVCKSCCKTCCDEAGKKWVKNNRNADEKCEKRFEKCKFCKPDKQDGGDDDGDW